MKDGLWTTKERNLVLFPGERVCSPLQLAAEQDKECHVRYFDGLMASVAVPERCVLLGTYGRYDVSRPSDGNGVVEIYIPTIGRRDAIDTQCPIICAVGRDCLKLAATPTSNLHKTTEELLATAGDLRADYMNRLDFYSPNDLREQKMEFYIQGHKAGRGTDYSRFLLGIPRIAPSWRDRSTEHWRRELKIARVAGKFVAEKGLMITTLFHEDPFIDPALASVAGARLPYHNSPYRRDVPASGRAYLWHGQMIFEVARSMVGDGRLIERSANVSLGAFLDPHADLAALVSHKPR